MELVGGTEVDAVGGGSCVVVVSGGGSVVAVVVWTGGEVTGGDVAGGLVPVLRGAVVTTGGAVVGVKTDGPGATVVDVSIVVVVGPEDVVDGEADVVVGRTVVVGATVDVEPWLATCCLGESSSPVATSKRSAAKAMVARA